MYTVLVNQSMWSVHAWTCCRLRLQILVIFLTFNHNNPNNSAAGTPIRLNQFLSGGGKRCRDFRYHQLETPTIKFQVCIDSRPTVCETVVFLSHRGIFYYISEIRFSVVQELHRSSISYLRGLWIHNDFSDLNIVYSVCL